MNHQLELNLPQPSPRRIRFNRTRGATWWFARMREATELPQTSEVITPEPIRAPAEIIIAKAMARRK